MIGIEKWEEKEGDGVQKRVQEGGELDKGEVQKVRMGRWTRMIKGVMEEQKWGFKAMVHKGRIIGR